MCIQVSVCESEATILPCAYAGTNARSECKRFTVRDDAMLGNSEMRQSGQDRVGNIVEGHLMLCQ